MSTADIRQSVENGDVFTRVTASSQFPGSVYALVMSLSNRHQCKGVGVTVSPPQASSVCITVSCYHGSTITGPTGLLVGVCHKCNGPRWQALISLAEDPVIFFFNKDYVSRQASNV